MQRIVLGSLAVIMLIFLGSANETFSWKEVQALKKKGLNKSALEKLDFYIKSISSSKDYKEQIKAEVFRAGIVARFKEKSFLTNIENISRLHERVPSPYKELVKTILADQYIGYYQSNQWKINKRGTVAGNEDIETWSAKQFIDTTSRLYLAAIAVQEDRSLLQDYNELFDLPKDAEFVKLRPYLYDYVAHKALDFFVERGNWVFLENHSAIVMNLFARLKKFHGKENLWPYLDVRLRELKYLKEVQQLTQEDYGNKLLLLNEQFGSQNAVSMVLYEMAKFQQSNGDKYRVEPSNEAFKWGYKNAVIICRDLIAKFPETTNAINAKSLLGELSKKSLVTEVESVYVPGKIQQGILPFKNCDKAYLSIYKIDIHQNDFDYRHTQRGKHDIHTLLNEKNHIKTWEEDLTNDATFREEKVSFELPALSVGKYVIVSNIDKDILSKNSSRSIQSFWVSNLMPTAMQVTPEMQQIYVLDRVSGKPLEGVNVKVLLQKHTGDTDMIMSKASNKEGRVLFQNTKNLRGSLVVEYVYKNEVFISQLDRSYHGSGNERKRYTNQFFTDKALYKPLEKISFKGVVLQQQKENIRVAEDRKEIEVKLLDPNYQQVGSQIFYTNEYGSYSGFFMLPKGRMGGTYRLQSKFGSKAVEVAVYKRPSFEVLFNENKDEVKLGDNVKLSGLAKSYTGAPLTFAKVSYVVKRTVSYSPWTRRNISRHSSSIVLKEGEVLTNENGEFSVYFLAIPDTTISSKSQPTFNYEVVAKVIDANGETHETTKQIILGYSSLKIDFPANKAICLPEDTVPFKVNNLLGVQQDAECEVLLYKLQSESSCKRPNILSKPTIQKYSKEVFEKMFPHDKYLEIEEKPKKKQFIWQKKAKDKVVLGATLESGTYLLVVKTKDRKGEVVEAEKELSVIQLNNKKVGDPTFLSVMPLKNEVKSGEIVKLVVATSTKNAQIQFRYQFNEKVLDEGKMLLSNQQKVLSIETKDLKEGVLRIYMTMTKYNRQVFKTITIPVIDPNKTLGVHLITEKEVLRPDAKEKWKVVVKDNEGNPSEGELMVGMYDESLDQIVKHHWAFTKPHYTPFTPSWRIGRFARSKTSAYPYYFQGEKFQDKYRYKSYPVFNYYGWRAHRFGRVGARMNKSRMMAESMSMDVGQDAMMASVPAESNAGMEWDSGNLKEAKSPKSKDVASLRENFNTTAFFYPQIRIKETGESAFDFVVPSTMTRWRCMGLVYNKDLAVGAVEKSFEARKEMFVTPNMPRVLRGKDTVVIQTKVTNMTNTVLSAKVDLRFYDLISEESITGIKVLDSKNITIPASLEKVVSWELVVPDEQMLIGYEVKAVSENHTDVLRDVVTIHRSKIVLTKTQPLFFQPNSKEVISLNIPKDVRDVKQLTIEMTSNPIWNAVLALPYVSKKKPVTSDGIANRYFSNALSYHVVENNPQIEKIFQVWRVEGNESLKSPLLNQEDVKPLNIQQTPWLQEANTETQNRANIAVFFDQNRLKHEMNQTQQALFDRQLSSGGWSWCRGGRASFYTTNNILGRLGHLMRLTNGSAVSSKYQKNIKRAIDFLDSEMQRMHQLHKNNTYPFISGLYTRSFYLNEIPLNKKEEEIVLIYLDKLKKNWTSFTLKDKALVAMILHRYEEKEMARLIVKSLMENSLTKKGKGIYWRDIESLPKSIAIDAQATIIEALLEIAAEKKEEISQMQLWMLMHKRVHGWGTGANTAFACYSLLSTHNLLPSTNKLSIVTQQGNPVFTASQETAAGIEYQKQTWRSAEIPSEFKEMVVDNQNEHVSWGAVYVQKYVEEDQVKAHEGGLRIEKQFFITKQINSGTELERISKDTQLSVGESVTVRMVVTTDRSMDFMHIQDNRPVGMEPKSVLSGYKYNSGVGFYQTISDDATHFYFDHLPKGKLVLEYDVVPTVAGKFTSGIAKLASYYAPEFQGNSGGGRIEVK